MFFIKKEASQRNKIKTRANIIKFSYITPVTLAFLKFHIINTLNLWIFLIT